MKQRWILLIILVLASCIRLVGLGELPSSLYWEEAALGYDAYSLWKTGKDYHGNLWPIVAFESFGDYKPSGYFYVAAPFVGIFGLNNWSIRLPSAIAGIISVYLVYLIAKELFKKENVGLWSAFSLTIMPWHIQFSRSAFEVNLAVMWMMFGIFLLLRTVRRPSLMWLGTIAFVLAAYTYHGLRITGPLMAMTLTLINFKKIIVSKWFWISGITAFVLMLPLLINLSNPLVNQRFKETSLFSTSPGVFVTNQLREEDDNTLTSRLIHHRYLYWFNEVLAGISDHFSVNFLFLLGDGNLRHQTGYTGLLYIWQILPIGITVFTIGRKQKKTGLLLIFWLWWAALPSALTNLTPHSLRFLPAAPMMAIVTGYGLWRLFSFKKIYLNGSLGLIMGISIFLYGFDYLNSYPKRSEFEWQTGYKQMVDYVASIEMSYEQIQVTRAYGRPSIYFLYYLQKDPATIQAQDSQLPKDQGELLAFDKYKFGQIDLSVAGLAISDEKLPAGNLINTINSESNRPVFYIYEI